MTKINKTTEKKYYYYRDENYDEHVYFVDEDNENQAKFHNRIDLYSEAHPVELWRITNLEDVRDYVEEVQEREYDEEQAQDNMDAYDGEKWNDVDKLKKYLGRYLLPANELAEEVGIYLDRPIVVVIETAGRSERKYTTEYINKEGTGLDYEAIFADNDRYQNGNITYTTYADAVEAVENEGEEVKEIPSIKLLLEYGEGVVFTDNGDDQWFSDQGAKEITALRLGDDYYTLR